MSRPKSILQDVWGGVPAGSPEPVNRRSYLAYFSNIGTEYDRQAEWLETRLLAGSAPKSFAMKQISNPAQALEDVCCFTTVSKEQLQTVVPSMFASYRRLKRAEIAYSRVKRVPKQRRLELAAGGLQAMLDSLGVDSIVDADIEWEIDDRLEGMFGACAWSGSSHLGSICRKPVAWSKADMGGGRSGR